MKSQMNIVEHGLKGKRKSVTICVHLCLITLVLLLVGCSELEKPKPEPYYAETAPPPKQEFRWSNGKTPKSFDPARAAAPPETDIVRAVFEGLTDTDPKTLKPIPAIAEKWTSSEDKKIWTFELRENAKWSNGDTVIAEDFVRSWKRLSEMRDEVSHKELLNNIVGLKIEKEEELPLKETNDSNDSNSLFKQVNPPKLPLLDSPSSNTNTSKVSQKNETKPIDIQQEKKSEPKVAQDESKKKKDLEQKLGVEAIGKYTLKVTLIKPDKDFPALVAHPIFRPVHSKTEFVKDDLNPDVITNGAFRITSVGQEGVTIDRAENYWSRESVELERVIFVPQENAEKALEAYRDGEVDAVTNADFEPLALKLLEPFDDFRRTVHSALNFYEFNRNRFPYNDRRVREALAISIERERLTDDDMDGASKPALGFLPYAEKREAKLSQNKERGKKLLEEAGFPNGENFPSVKLHINRNNIQQKIAKSVAKMWKQNLNIETEIIIKENEDLDATKKSGDFDVIRRGVVLPTSDEAANMSAIFSSEKKNVNTKKDDKDSKNTQNNINPDVKIDLPHSNNLASEVSESKTHLQNPLSDEDLANEENSENDKIILTEEDAILELPAIPLYFPTSYSLVKPYVEGFDINTLDAPSLKDVRINNFWQPKKTNKES
jgi:oligopeptide transport system substrate-binding protein